MAMRDGDIPRSCARAPRRVWWRAVGKARFLGNSGVRISNGSLYPHTGCPPARCSSPSSKFLGRSERPDSSPGRLGRPGVCTAAKVLIHQGFRGQSHRGPDVTAFGILDGSTPWRQCTHPACPDARGTSWVSHFVQEICCLVNCSARAGNRYVGRVTRSMTHNEKRQRHRFDSRDTDTRLRYAVYSK